MKAVNPFVFIVGCPRSGTTMLRRMVDAHPLVAITRETHWIPDLLEEPGLVTSEGFVTDELIHRLVEHPRFPKLKIAPAELAALRLPDAKVTYSQFVSKLFDVYGQARSKRLVGDKTPGYVRHVATLHTLWPSARFVHLIRDGRDVCLSAVSWDRAKKLKTRFRTWSDDPVSTAALWWEWHVRLGREGGSRLDAGLYYEIRYESLVLEPEEACRALCDFLNLPYHPAMLRYHEGRQRKEPGLDAKHAWLPPTAGLRDWRVDMRDEDLVRFEAAVGELLDELRYPRGVDGPPADAIRRASMVREAFEQDVRSRHLPLPQYPVPVR